MTTKNQSHRPSSPHQLRRRSVGAGLAALSGGLLFRSLASGVPLSVLLDPLSASAADHPLDAPVLILSVSAAGDPFSCNVPGTYGLEGAIHPPGLKSTSLTLSGQPFEAAEVWSAEQGGFFSQAQLDRTMYFHHSSGTPIHGDMDRVQRMLDTTDNNDMLISLVSSKLAQKHPTSYIQSDPITLGAIRGAELLTAGGRNISNASPRAVKQALLGVSAPFNEAAVRTARDETLRQLEALYKARGNTGQRRLLEAWAQSRSRVRNLPSNLKADLEQVGGDSQADQVITAVVLAAARIAPVITVHLDFGGDNHADPGLVTEQERHQGTPDELGGPQLLANLMTGLEQKPVGDKTAADHTFVGVLNVFGRTFVDKTLGDPTRSEGRDHNRDHNVLMLHGPTIVGGVVGGLEKTGERFSAMSIDASSGAGVAEDGGEIPLDATLASAGKTLAYAMGLDEETVKGLTGTAGSAIVKSVVKNR
jgi:hypothetical protein